MWDYSTLYSDSIILYFILFDYYWYSISDLYEWKPKLRSLTVGVVNSMRSLFGQENHANAIREVGEARIVSSRTITPLLWFSVRRIMYKVQHALLRLLGDPNNLSITNERSWYVQLVGILIAFFFFSAVSNHERISVWYLCNETPIFFMFDLIMTKLTLKRRSIKNGVNKNNQVNL
jgi:hypothetical protein